MLETQFYTISVPQANANVAPAVVTTAASAPIRVLMRNTGPVPVFVAKASTDLQVAGGAVSAVYRLPAGQVDVFIIAPRQTIYVGGVGAGAEICVSISEAFPEAIRTV